MNNLEAALVWLEDDGRILFGSAFLCFIRIGAVLALLPTFGERIVPVRLRVGVALAFTAVVAPGIKATVAVTLGACLSEAICGLALGAGFRMLVLALQTAGAIAAQSTSLSAIFGGAAADPLPAFSHLLAVSALALSFSIGLHIHAAEILIRSYDLFPQGRVLSAAGFAEWGTAQVSRAFGLAFVLASPFVIGSVIYNVALGVINRAMPSLMVSFVGAPAITLGGLALMALTAPVILAIWLREWLGWLADPFTLLR